ncbi:hypothetical protein AGMMS49928_06850 [Spirochaetia bacterium]|nr:hypothetical protein AGMMS49928_06850 [Spirochaetia bacterium]
MSGEKQFRVYEYKNVTVPHNYENIYLDSLPNFGWQPDGNVPFLSPSGIAEVSLKFKRDRGIKNKAELSWLERDFENNARMITALEKSKESRAKIAAFSIGIFGTAFMAGSVFAFTAGMLPLMIILAASGFLGWLFPYFCYKKVKARHTKIIAPFIDEQYSALYDVCEKAHEIIAVY